MCGNHWIRTLRLITTNRSPTDGIFRIWLSISCLLMPWFLKSPEHQQAWHWLCRRTACIVILELILSTWVKPTPRCNSKCEYILCYILQNNLTCWELTFIHLPVTLLSSGGRFKNTYELLNLRALKISKLHKNHIFQCMGKIFCVEFQRVPLNSTQNILPIHWKMWILFTYENLWALWFKSS